jgi:hypothetical protein
VLFEDAGTEVPLVGGDVTEGLVRVGDTIRRPHGTWSEGVRALLTELERSGFDGAPRHLGIDSKGRDVLTFVHGEVASRPWPGWVADDDRAVSVARLVREYDDAAMAIGLPEWSHSLVPTDVPGAPASSAARPEFVAHLDITPENVVFVDGAAHALIDFDLARPAERVEELCNLLLWWGSWMPPEDREPVTASIDAAQRGILLVDAYGASDADRLRIVPMALNQAARSWHTMKFRAETIGGGWKRMWDDGVGDRILRRRAWLEANAPALHDAVTSRS